MKCVTKLAAVTLVSVCAVGSVRAEEKQADWKPLWNGKDFAGWHEIGSGQWTIEDGAIVGRHERSDPKFGHLVTDKTYTDFTARLKFKTIKGNSGFYFRVDKQGFSGVEGFQAEIDPTHDTGGLYDTGGRAWVVKPTAEEFKRFFKPHQWNEMIVTAKGRNVTVHVNGVKTADLTNDPGRVKGHIALQLHGGNEMLVMFKDIEIREKQVDRLAPTCARRLVVWNWIAIHRPSSPPAPCRWLGGLATTRRVPLASRQCSLDA